MDSSSHRRPILIVAYYFPPENTSGAARPFRFYKYLREFGYEPYVITSSPHPGTATPNVYCVPGLRDVAGADRQTLRGISEMVLRKYFMSYSENLTWIPDAVAEVRRVAPPGGFHAVLSTSPPATTHLLAWRLHKQLDIPWIADFRDPIAGNATYVGQRLTVQPAVDRWLQRSILERANLVIANTANVAEDWKRNYPRAASKLHVIWNGFDPSENVAAAPLPARPYRVLAHTGILYADRHPGMLLASVERLIARGVLDPSTIRIELTGEISHHTLPVQIGSFTRAIESGCLQCEGVHVARTEATRRTQEADYLLLFDVLNAAAGRQVPAKIFDYLRIGRPVLAFTVRGSGTDYILERSGIPYVSVYLDDTDDRVDEKLTAFLRFPTDPVEPSSWFLQNFDGREQTGTLAGLLDSLCGAPQHAEVQR